MLLLIGLLFRLALVLLAVFVLFLLFRAFVWLLKGVTRVCAALLAAVGVGLVASGSGVADEIATISGAAVFPVALWVTVAWSGRRRPGHDVPHQQLHGSTTEAAVGSCVYEGASEPKGDTPVTAAWQTLVAMVPVEDLPRLYVAREKCARLLGRVEGGTMDIELLECAVLLRRNLPELAERVDALWEGADVSERDDLSAVILHDTNMLGERTAALLDRHRKDLRDNLEAVRRHIAARTEPGA